MEKQKQIEICFKSIESLKGLLKIVGSGAIVVMGYFVFFKSEFNDLAAKTLLISIGLIIALVVFEIFRKYAIIARINLDEGAKNDN